MLRGRLIGYPLTRVESEVSQRVNPQEFTPDFLLGTDTYLRIELKDKS
jgi:hypothetical protein